jgi:hypothetical protein
MGSVKYPTDGKGVAGAPVRTEESVTGIASQVGKRAPGSRNRESRWEVPIGEMGRVRPGNR